ncbi:NAD-dependent epimerase/dehydratase family protein [Catellatospora tritici]|uniref:NAD-dependent epimerase/dehydratase family protein n=1 Tax=Catellatospora tritici TaxID=2851566 RepID=UPI001C2DEEDB|nr:NAD-dependent epimerase/dehydratase family protein [Catellatospora tritici]MBV1849086.1 NAD-dependent epimerase/dehydratase family protein [Catellatospora tritici]
MHVIVGAGPVGSSTARLLAARGERVRMITRRGTGPAAPGIELVAADATDADRLTELTAGASALYNCANPLYHRWLTDWPPLADSLLRAAERSGAVLVIAGNLYGYGPVTAPIDEYTPLAATHPKLRIRAQMWEDALALHRAGRIRVTEVRASDYLGFQANSGLGDYVLARTTKGSGAMMWGDPDAPHSWTAIPDVARTLVAVSGDERAWGSAWLVPTPPAISARQAAVRANELIGAPAAKVSRMPYPMLWSAGLFSPMIKEMRTTYYQFAKPFTMDSSLTERTFGLAPTPMDETLADTAARYCDA